jgi:CRP/FNR family transcriptional regulator, cyclic AMP receptor protein
MNIEPLIAAVVGLVADDAFQPRLSRTQWQALVGCMTRFELEPGRLLIPQGDFQSTAYLLEHGSLEVFVSGGVPGSHRIAVLRAGSRVGEPALFLPVSRMANVEAMTHFAVWCVTDENARQFARVEPGVALEALRAAGAVMAARMRANLLRGIPIV